MKRRNFIRNSAVSAISLGMFTPGILASPLTFQSASPAHWLQPLNWALSVKRRFNAPMAPESFTQLISQTNDYLEQRGYQRENDTFYFFGEQEAWCFYLHPLRHTAFATPPFLVPVLHRRGDSWYLVKTLSGFEVEAISRASQALVDLDPAALLNLLIPTREAGSCPGATAYRTRDGIVAIKTVQRAGKSQTSCTITGREGTVFSETFVSRHCLTA